MAQINAPEIFVVARNRTDCCGAVRNLIEFTEDVRFNACSELTIKVPRRIYNEHIEQWIDNPIYDKLVEGQLLYVCDDTQYFKCPVRVPGDATFYKRNLVTDPTKARDPDTLTLNMNDYLSTFKVYPETTLFDIGARDGYRFYQFQKINGATTTKPGELMDYSQLLNSYSNLSVASNYYQYSSCQEFIPIGAADVLALENWMPNGYKLDASGDESSDTTPYKCWTWHVECYTEADTATFVGEMVHSGNHVTRVDVSSILPNGGYIRLWLDCGNASSAYFDLSGDASNYSAKWNHVYPEYGFAKIFSGERRCSSVSLATSSGWVYPKLHWFAITNTSEEDDGICRTKTVTANSYEYTLSHKTISTSEDTLALYTPPAIYELVNGLNTSGYMWLRDCYVGDDNTTIYGPGMAQHMPKGLLNYVLDEYPGWQLGNISAKLMTTYRAVPAVDDTDIYTFLMNTVQQLYHCIFVFDSDNKTISAYTYDDILSGWNGHDERDGRVLSWDNAIQSFSKENKATESFTSLRVHTNDDQYGVGLINPTGNNVIYNFNAILDQLDFVPSGSPSGSRTLRTAVEAWQTAFNDSISTYRSKAKEFIAANMRLIKAETSKSTALTNYRVVADKINAYLTDDYSGDLALPEYLLGETPISLDQAKNRTSSLCHNNTLKEELRTVAYAYQQASAELVTAYDNMYGTSGKLAALKAMAAPLTLNPLATNNDAILTPLERAALLDYLKEGTWRDENSVFSETYGVDDIYDTLLGVYDAAMYDLKNRLSSIQYDFSIDLANIDAIPELSHFRDKIYMGRPFYLSVSPSELILPLLLEKHINYKDDSDFSLTFTTDVKRRPLEFRYADLYSTITQTSITENGFTFDT